MLVLPTAKILLFIALNVGPQNAPQIYATSNSESYVWTSTATGWNLEAKGFPASDCTRDPNRYVTFSGNPAGDALPPFIHSIAHHHWRNNYAMVFDNGDRVEKSGDHAYYIVNAGAANEKIFTIFFSAPAKS